jgi:hypothetical protein
MAQTTSATMNHSAGHAAQELGPSTDLGGEKGSGPTGADEATGQDWNVANGARPDMDGESSDGLSELDEEVRYAAEDLPADESWEDRVRRRAYELWESEGWPEGRESDHWRIAEQLVAEEEGRLSGSLPYGGDEEAPAEDPAISEGDGDVPGLTDQGRNG